MFLSFFNKRNIFILLFFYCIIIFCINLYNYEFYINLYSNFCFKLYINDNFFYLSGIIIDSYKEKDYIFIPEGPEFLDFYWYRSDTKLSYDEFCISFNIDDKMRKLAYDKYVADITYIFKYHNYDFDKSMLDIKRMISLNYNKFTLNEKLQAVRILKKLY